MQSITKAEVVQRAAEGAVVYRPHCATMRQAYKHCSSFVRYLCHGNDWPVTNLRRVPPVG